MIWEYQHIFLAFGIWIETKNRRLGKGQRVQRSDMRYSIWRNIAVKI